MKKLKMLPLLLLTTAPGAIAQCQEPVQLPYLADFESVTAPALPGCMFSVWDSFASYEVFESIPGPVAGFTGNLLAYNTIVNTEFGTPSDSYVSASLTTPSFEMEEGNSYVLTFRYANSSPEASLAWLGIYLREVGGGHVELDVLENVTGTTPTDYISVAFTPPATGIYAIDLTVATEGSQGLFYIDDIGVNATTQMETETNDRIALSLFPNPARDLVNFRSSTSVDSFEIYSSTGQLLLAGTPNTASPSINISSLAPGIYTANIQTGGSARSIRILKE